jgi:hypothetical protein
MFCAANTAKHCLGVVKSGASQGAAMRGAQTHGSGTRQALNDHQRSDEK